MKFLVSGIAGQFPDSQRTAKASGILPLTQAWTKYSVDLTEHELAQTSSVASTGPLAWRTNSIDSRWTEWAGVLSG